MKPFLSSLLLSCSLFGAACSDSSDAVQSAATGQAEDCCTDELGQASLAAPPPGDSLFHLAADFTDTSNQVLHLSDFAGRPTIVTMFFSSCEYACPVLVEDLKKLEAMLTEDERAEVQWLLVSFDVARDTPEALKLYSEKNDIETWTLCHADAASVRELAAVLGMKYKQTDGGGFSHSNRLTLLDAQGRFAKYVDGLNSDVSVLHEALVSLRTSVE